MAIQQLRDYFIADRLENLNEYELYVLERDNQGKLKYPDAYQKIVDQAIRYYHTQVTLTPKNGLRSERPLSGT